MSLWIWMGMFVIISKTINKRAKLSSLLHNSEKLDNVETQGANNCDKCSGEDCELCGGI